MTAAENDRLGKVIAGLQNCTAVTGICTGGQCPYFEDCGAEHGAEHMANEPVIQDALLVINSLMREIREHNEQVQQWLMVIADNQLAKSPNSPDEVYKKGVWDGLELAYEIITGDLSRQAASKIEVQAREGGGKIIPFPAQQTHKK